MASFFGDYKFLPACFSLIILMACKKQVQVKTTNEEQGLRYATSSIAVSVGTVCDYDLDETTLTSGWTKQFEENFSANFNQ